MPSLKEGGARVTGFFPSAHAHYRISKKVRRSASDALYRRKYMCTYRYMYIYIYIYKGKIETSMEAYRCAKSQRYSPVVRREGVFVEKWLSRVVRIMYARESRVGSCGGNNSASRLRSRARELILPTLKNDKQTKRHELRGSVLSRSEPAAERGRLLLSARESPSLPRPIRQIASISSTDSSNYPDAVFLYPRY